ncbi:MAG TPA: c-type cytochrome [Acidobacteriota bacterium]|nr:c-type cytochrome [Acidobacteriota bacterium]
MHKATLGLMVLALGAAAAATAFFSQPIQAQQQEDGFKNLQYFPSDISRPELIGRMRNFSFALGAPCTHCHGTEEQTGFNLQGVDFSLDIKPTKAKAREMLKIVDAINGELLSGLSSRSDRGLEVSCFTCHSGAPLPETVEHRVLRVVAEQGAEAAVDDYRKLRERYFGSAAFNFKEQPLVEVSSELFRQDQAEASLKIAQLNLEFHPRSRQSVWRAAQAHERLGNIEKAREGYQKLLELAPNHPLARKALENLKDK